VNDQREAWTDDERRALGLWQAPEPAADLAARVTASRPRPVAGWARAGAAAALAVVIAGGMLTIRLSAREGGSAGSARTRPYDGGSAAEVSAAADGLRS